MKLSILCVGLASGLLAISAAAPAADPLPPTYACTTAQALATQACLDVLAFGGNAFDAAIAATAMLAVVDPSSSGFGGGGFWLLHRASDALDVLIDGREQAPAASNAAAPSAFPAAIPGEPAALDAIAKRYASRPLSALLAPAIAAARDGIVIDAAFAQKLVATPPRSWAARKLLLTADGRPLAVGARLRQNDLAQTLSQFAAGGRRAFYEGAVADRLLAAVQAADGHWTAADLRRYQAAEREPLVFDYRGYHVTSAPPPSAGGMVIAELLGQLEINAWRDDGSAAAAQAWRASLNRAAADAATLGDPDVGRSPLVDLLAREHLRELAARRSEPAPAPASLPTASGGTALTVLDAKGNRVSATLSLGRPFGSGFLVPASGVFLNDALDDFNHEAPVSANVMAANRRPLSAMTPLFAEGPRGLLLAATAVGRESPAAAALAVVNWLRGADPSNAANGPLQTISWDVAAGTLTPAHSELPVATAVP